MAKRKPINSVAYRNRNNKNMLKLVLVYLIVTDYKSWLGKYSAASLNIVEHWHFKLIHDII